MADGKPQSCFAFLSLVQITIPVSYLVNLFCLFHFPAISYYSCQLITDVLEEFFVIQQPPWLCGVCGHVGTAAAEERPIMLTTGKTASSAVDFAFV